MVRRIDQIEISEKSLLDEFKKISQENHKGYDTGNYWNEIVLYFQWKEFYKHELSLWDSGIYYKKTPIQSYIYANRLKYINKSYLNLTNREILRSFKITGIYIGNSFHSPFYIKQFIKDYNIKSIYDPCGGWGHRLLGASHIRYIYNDINTTTYENCFRMSKYFNLQNKIFYNEDAAKLTPEEDYEAVFTCPPYFKKEWYCDKGAENLNYDEFLAWWNSVIKHAVKPSTKYFAFIISSDLKEDMQEICTQSSLHLVSQIILGSNRQISHLNKAKKNQEILLIYKNEV